MFASFRMAFQPCHTCVAPSKTHVRSLTSIERPLSSRRILICKRHVISTCKVSYSSEPSSRRPPRPKQSLGQSFLKDANMIRRIVDTFNSAVEATCAEAHVVEVGPGLGALTNRLAEQYPKMRAIEIDQRVVKYLAEEYPGLDVRHGDVLDVNWGQMSSEMGGRLAVIGNLPYNIVSQILFSLLEAPGGSIGIAVVMMQKEVAERLVARTRTKAYGILSVVGQLYGRPKILFSVPNTVFYPKPDVTSAIVMLEFEPDESLDVRNTTLTRSLRKVVRMAFNQRRKTLRNSLRVICKERGVDLKEEWVDKRAEELEPREFVRMTEWLFKKDLENAEKVSPHDNPIPVWR